MPPDIGPLVRELVQRLERTNRALALVLERLGTADARLAQTRAEARDAVLRSGERWPFRRPH